MAYSTAGSSTNLTVLGLIKQFNVTAKPVATGSPASTFTQVMSGQVDAGWSSPPFGVEAIKKGAFDYLQKPFELDELRRFIEKALRFHELKQENSQLRSELERAQGSSGEIITRKDVRPLRTEGMPVGYLYE